MTKLPATYAQAVEVAALRHARERLICFHFDTTPWSEDSPLTKQAARAYTRDLLWQMALSPYAGFRMRVVQLARGGEPDAYQVLRELILEMKSRRQERPLEYEPLDAECDLYGSFDQPPGPKRKSNLLRDVCIALTVAELMDLFGLDPHGRSRHRRSACEIVAQALEEVRMRLGHKAVEKIWGRYEGGMPTRPGWASA